MNEGSGTTFTDTSGNSNTITSSLSNFAWTANAVKTGVTSPLWNGSVAGGSSSSGSYTNFSASQSFSVAIWVKSIAASYGAEQAFINTLNVTGGTYQGWDISKRSSSDTGPNQFTAILVNSVLSNNYIQVRATTSINDANLHYLVMTYNGSSTAAGVTMYVDGTASSTAVDQDSLSGTIAGAQPVQVAQRNDGSLALSGATGYAEVYNCALTSGQVSTYYARGPGIN